MLDCNETDKLILDAVRDAIRDGIKTKLGSPHNNPLDKVIADCISRHNKAISGMIDDAILMFTSPVKISGQPNFREDFVGECHKIIAKQLLAKFSGEIEKTVNTLKSDPSTRAKITLAVDECVRSLTTKG